jgi:hypothetical protein
MQRLSKGRALGFTTLPLGGSAIAAVRQHWLGGCELNRITIVRALFKSCWSKSLAVESGRALICFE